MIASILVVAADAAKQTAVGGGDVIVVVEHDGGQCRCVDLILVFGRDTFAQAWIEGMVAFENKDVALFELEEASRRHILSGGKIEEGEFDAFAVDEAADVVVEEGEIERFDMFKVVVSLFI